MVARRLFVATCTPTVPIDAPQPIPHNPHSMIEALKSDEIVKKVGGRFKLTALIQKRMLELMDGARPLVVRDHLTDLETVIQEILQDKIAIDYEASGLIKPDYEPTAGH